MAQDIGDQQAVFTPDVLIIPGVVAFDEKLQPLDIKVYGVVYWLERLKDGRCFASNATISKIVGSSPSGVSHSLGRLVDRGYIVCTFGENNQRTGIITCVHMTPSSNEQGGVAQMSNRKSNNKKEYMSETYSDEEKQQILKIYMRYLIRFKVDPDDWHEAERLHDSVTQQRLVDEASKGYKLTPKRKKQVKVRLADAGLDMILKAIDNAAKKSFNHGDNDRGWKADLCDYLLRNYEMVERWANET